MRENATAGAEHNAEAEQVKKEKFGETLRRAANDVAARLGERRKDNLAGLCLFEDTIREMIDDVRAALFPEVFCCNDGAAATDFGKRRKLCARRPKSSRAAIPISFFL